VASVYVAITEVNQQKICRVNDSVHN